MPVAFSPQNRDAELGVIGSVLLDNAIIVDLVRLKPDHFYHNDTQISWRHIEALYADGKPIDQITLIKSLTESGDIKEANDSFVLNCIRSVPHSRHASRYADIVYDMAVQRSILDLADHLIERVSSGEVVAEELIAEATQKILNIGEGSTVTEVSDVRDKVMDLFDSIKKNRDTGWNLPGVSTGFPELDDMIGGFQRSHLIILAARPGMGKTGLGLNLLENMAIGFGRPVAIASLEMSNDELIMRLIGTVAGISNKKIKNRTGLTDRHISKLEAASHIIRSSSSIMVSDKFNMTPIGLLSFARKMKTQKKIEVFMLDYIQLVDASDESPNRQEQVSKIARTLKAIARMLDIPVVALAQLNRDLEKREDKRPIMSDLRECVAGSSTVVDARTGIPHSMESIVDQERKMEIHSVDNDGKIIVESIEKSWKSGEKQLYEIMTESGKTLECSDMHRFKTYDGWKRLHEIKPFDRVAVTRYLPEPIEPVCELTDRQIRIIARMSSGGLYMNKRPMRFATADIGELYSFVRDIEGEFHDEFQQALKYDLRESRKYHTATISSGGIGKIRYSESMERLFAKAGIKPGWRWDSTIPHSVFSLPNDKLKLFISTAMSGDKFMIKRKKNKVAIARFFCLSPHIASSLQLLLMRFSVVSRLEKPYHDQKYSRYYWPLVIDPNSVQILLDKIGIDGKNRVYLQEVIDSAVLDRYPTHIDRIPKEANGSILEAKKRSGKSWKTIGTRFQGGELLRDKVSLVSEACDDDELRKVANSDIVWERVVSVHPTRTAMAYDLTAGKYENYTPNQFITHNSGAIEQDADIIMFIYRDEQYNKGTNENMVELIIAKNRHGETGTVEMNFHKKTTQFVSCGVMEAPLAL